MWRGAKKISFREGTVVVTLLLAFAISPLFHGPEIKILSGVLMLLIAAFSTVLLSAYRTLSLPWNGLAGALLFYWLWLGLSVFWSPAPAVSLNIFLWLSVLPLSFFAYSINRDEIWPYLAGGGLAIVVILACVGIFQQVVLGKAPSSLFITQNTHAAMMNLVALPTAGYFLRHLHWNKPAAGLAISLFILFFSIAQTGGRGGILSLVLGLGLIFILCWKHTRKIALAQLLALAVVAFALADLQTGNLVIDRIATLNDLETAAFNRLVIWGPAWDLVKMSPWIGSGLGCYYLLASRVRHFDDSSAGFFVHNDYLQTWLETGLVGLGLLLLVIAALCRLFMDLVRKTELKLNHRFESVGIFAGLLAVGAHSFVDFNFYIIAILIAMGIMMARLYQLAGRLDSNLTKTFVPARWMGWGSFRWVVFSLPALVALYMAPLSVAEHFRLKAINHYARGQLQEAEQALFYALKWNHEDAKILNQQAELYHHALTLSNTGISVNERSSLLKNAFLALDRAAGLNPLPGITAEIRGHLYVKNHDLIGADWRNKAIHAYQKALRQRPRLYRARMAYADLLWQQGSRIEALALIDHGLHYVYGSNPGVNEFYRFGIDLHQRAGNFERVKALQSQFNLPLRRGESRAADTAGLL